MSCFSGHKLSHITFQISRSISSKYWTRSVKKKENLKESSSSRMLRWTGNPSSSRSSSISFPLRSDGSGDDVKAHRIVCYLTGRRKWIRHKSNIKVWLTDKIGDSEVSCCFETSSCVSPFFPPKSIFLLRVWGQTHVNTVTYQWDRQTDKRQRQRRGVLSLCLKITWPSPDFPWHYFNMHRSVD